jgi:hypothetical protein
MREIGRDCWYAIIHSLPSTCLLPAHPKWGGTAIAGSGVLCAERPVRRARFNEKSSPLIDDSFPATDLHLGGPGDPAKHGRKNDLREKLPLMPKDTRGIFFLPFLHEPNMVPLHIARYAIIDPRYNFE